MEIHFLSGGLKMSSDLTFEELRKLRSDVKPYTGGPHPGACHGKKIDMRRPKFRKTGKPNRNR
jgi:hypothetical protein